MSTARVPEWTLGDRLRKSREDKGLSREQMRERLLAHGITTEPRTIGAWETDANRPGRRNGYDPFVVVRAWAAICEVPIDWLLPDQGRSPMPWTPTPARAA